MKMKNKTENDTLRQEYDFDYSQAVRGKYYQQLLAEGSNVVVLEPDIAKVFSDSDSVNKALRYLLKASKIAMRKSDKLSRISVKPKSGGS